MKSKRCLIPLVFTITTLLIFYTSHLEAAGWTIETVDSEDDAGDYTSLALDSGGNPHISYWEAANDDLKYAYYDGIWHIEMLDSTGNVCL